MILLDLDGTLLDGKWRHYQCYRDILESHGFPCLDMETFWENKRRRVPTSQQLAATGAEAIQDLYAQEWLGIIEAEEYLRLDRLHGGVLETLQGWQGRAFGMTLVTMRNDRSALVRQLEAFGLLQFLDEVITSAFAHGGEGKANAVREKIPEIHRQPCLWIGDTEADATAARHLGCPVWLLSCGIRSVANLIDLKPDFISASLADVEPGQVLSPA